jgi:hypothetical protein
MVAASATNGGYGIAIKMKGRVSASNRRICPDRN